MMVRPAGIARRCIDVKNRSRRSSSSVALWSRRISRLWFRRLLRDVRGDTASDGVPLREPHHDGLGHGLVELEADDSLARLTAFKILRDSFKERRRDDVERVMVLPSSEGRNGAAINEVRRHSVLDGLNGSWERAAHRGSDLDEGGADFGRLRSEVRIDISGLGGRHTRRLSTSGDDADLPGEHTSQKHPERDQCPEQPSRTGDIPALPANGSDTALQRASIAAFMPNRAIHAEVESLVTASVPVRSPPPAIRKAPWPRRSWAARRRAQRWRSWARSRTGGWRCCPGPKSPGAPRRCSRCPAAGDRCRHRPCSKWP